MDRIIEAQAAERVDQSSIDQAHRFVDRKRYEDAIEHIDAELAESTEAENEHDSPGDDDSGEREDESREEDPTPGFGVLGTAGALVGGGYFAKRVMKSGEFEEANEKESSKTLVPPV